MRTITSIICTLSGKVVLNQFLGRLKLHRSGLLEGYVFQAPKLAYAQKFHACHIRQTLKQPKLPVKKQRDNLIVALIEPVKEPFQETPKAHEN